MPNLDIAINSHRMPYSTLLNQWVRGTENLYYFLLFSTKASYAGNADAWRSWIGMGFSVELKDCPPAGRSHRAVLTTYDTPRRVEMSFTGGDPDTLARLEELLRVLDGRRRSVAALAAPERAETLLNDGTIRKLVADPVRAAFSSCSLTEAERSSLIVPIQTALAALTSEYITSIETRANLPVSV